MPLTAMAVNAAKGRDKPYKISDSFGLYLHVSPSGSRLWRMNYRFDGKQRTLSFGPYPFVTLAAARLRRDEARELLTRRIDPMNHRREAERESRVKQEQTFGIICDEWLGRLELQGRSRRTIEKMTWLLGIAPQKLRDRPITEITAPDLLEVLRKVEAKGHYETAIRLRGTYGSIFRYAIATGRAQRDVAFDLRGALITPKVQHRAAILDPQELGGLLRAIEGHDGQRAVRIALRLAPHLFVRPGELRSAEWKEFDFEKAIWTIPPEKMKMRRRHRVPLSEQVVGMLAELHPISGSGQYLFPSLRTETRPISENTLNAALRRLGYDKTEVTAHGFRATASTLLNESGKWHPDAIERQLGHVENNDVRRA